MKIALVLALFTGVFIGTYVFEKMWWRICPCGRCRWRRESAAKRCRMDD